jgi:hypothetical protein
MNYDGSINRDSLVKDYLQRLITKEDILTDSEFYYLLKYSGRYGVSASRTVYKKLLKDADKFGFSGIHPQIIKHNLRNFQWVLDVCKAIIKK